MPSFATLGGETCQCFSPWPVQPTKALLDQVDAVDYPYLQESEPAPAAHVLLATASYLRIYSTGGCVGSGAWGWGRR